ncbi:ABC-type multidrug transport system ATPase subunit [Pullulanibacillus pueri]|uniref:ABC transporter ATP-binding protein n=1 Tax=Pullulanibacillus pueri TaxID=1437324 RepID=A0A8J2ZVQ8_9BACL|nr:ABC transporter ATP-binding protein [Pullulanibacillus pueri]MBM7680957.1 ABC-type multidrug transport system ATPase subunit [Pullulanibacillus pueri]GGH81486.1 ABC transporter ATP-binding protein [Pullulanibacillus pueri]
MNLILDKISKCFGDKIVLDDISLELTPGVYGILGANGSGKTTLMRILATVMNPSSGHISFNGQDINDMEHRYRELIGYLPQQVGLYKSFTAEKFLSYIAYLKGLTKAETQDKVTEVLDLVGLSEQRKEKVGKYSGGMKRRIGIAQALLNDPKLLIVDEPTAGLDPKERIRLRNLLSRISSHRIVLLSTHIVSDIEYIAKEVLILKEGQLIQKDTPQRLLNEIEGKVWTVQVSEGEILELQSKYKVVNIALVREKYELRILSDTRPHIHAISEVPHLEDLYLYHFDEGASQDAAVKV